MSELLYKYTVQLIVGKGSNNGGNFFFQTVFNSFELCVQLRSVLQKSLLGSNDEANASPSGCCGISYKLKKTGKL
ncbi:MAG TPA: hypothetical protein DDX39_09565 [Bacteroidales bacterium]|nr:MAG: hypothetical protein A2W98_15470 [Bacteroidetes bacterium GWF2_33_38]OFY73567.1 MAG: hypothetical protein A2265_09370 [Bacteroidetes bacterium RIFOXYA12_FULL_33_9]OFY91467.1 MAG: hypothetical protein A2236_03340 [Bacteroidetes bacterium RIFOXYA2_FULL_33_7]HBF88876.1 hypothetical protein [Bacteroidales bacterium]